MTAGYWCKIPMRWVIILTLVPVVTGVISDHPGVVRPVQAQRAAVGAWTRTGDMNVGLGFNTTTLLADGSVLVTGGAEAEYLPPEQYVERYSPPTQTWAQAGILPSAREGHTATALADGRVLMTGGYIYSSEPTYGTTDAYLYDPSTQAFSMTQSLHYPRYDAFAARLPNSRILVGGGMYESVETFTTIEYTTTEIYDPVTSSWSPAASMHVPHLGGTFVQLPDGRLLIAGGQSAHIEYGTTNTVEIYDPTVDTWTLAAPMREDRADAQAAVLADGRVLMVGGLGDGNGQFTTLSSAEIYDPARNVWSRAGQMTLQRTAESATTLADGRVLIAGGYVPLQSSTDLTVTQSTEIFDPRTLTWSPDAPMPSPHADHSAVLLKDGTVLVMGGSDGLLNSGIFPPGSVFTKESDLYHSSSVAPSLSVVPSSGTPYGTSIVLSGTTGLPHESVAFYWDQVGVTATVTTTTSDTGAFLTSLIVPPLAVGPHILYARGQISQQTASTSFTIVPGLYLFPPLGHAGSVGFAIGVGEGAQESVLLFAYPSFTVLSYGSTTTQGTVTLPYIMPQSPTGSVQYLVSYGLTSHQIAVAALQTALHELTATRAQLSHQATVAANAWYALRLGR